MKKALFYFLVILLPAYCSGQADNEIQVYASAITPGQVTLVELHQNYTFNGMKDLPDPKQARWIEETVEITRGLGKNFELGFYTFTGIAPNGRLEYLGNHIRPRYTFPSKNPAAFGTSISLELGFIRADAASSFQVDGELRPIIDRTFDKWYFSFNPNVAFVLTGPDKAFKFGPQFKTVYAIPGKFGLGFEYYSDLGSFSHFNSFKQQEHLLGPVFDLYSSPNWELQTGILFGLTPGSNQQVFKLIAGRRFKKKG